MNRRGYTLVEMMVATALTLVIMVAVVNGFGFIGDKITNARAALEMSEELRGASARLIADLEGVTAPMTPPLSPGAGQGYFEITEGPGMTAVDNDAGGIPDTTVGDLDDYVMFTTRSRSAPFVGRHGGSVVESHEAEVAWFIRGRTLYRRVLLIAPNLGVGQGVGYYANGDLAGGSLSDLTNPANRFAHQPRHYLPSNNPDPETYWGTFYPFHPHFFVEYEWDSFNSRANFKALHRSTWSHLGLPTLAECSSPNWNAGGMLAARPGPWGTLDTAAAVKPDPLDGNGLPFDAWRNPHPYNQLSSSTGSLKAYCDPDAATPVTTARMNEDIILNNVLSFDVKVWDPGAPLFSRGTPATIIAPGDPGFAQALTDYNLDRTVPANQPVAFGAFVNLAYAPSYGLPAGATTMPRPAFNGLGNSTPHYINPNMPRVYDTWSTHFDEGGPGTDGFDNGGVAGVVDDPGELNFPPPYSAQLRGVQIKIRTYEPSTRQVREVTVVHNFVSK